MIHSNTLLETISEKQCGEHTTEAVCMGLAVRRMMIEAMTEVGGTGSHPAPRSL